MFSRYIGIDYSGAETAEASLPSLRVYAATPHLRPTEVPPPTTTKKHWTRQAIAHHLAADLLHAPPTLVAIDHGLSFPLPYFQTHNLPLDWPGFLDDFQAHWPTDKPNTYVEFIRDGICGNGAARQGNSRWRRLTEIRTPRAKSVFHFDCQGSVAKSTHAGLPWLRYLRQNLGPKIHYWPFDGWTPPANSHVIAEAYPALYSKSKRYPQDQRNPHQHDAYVTAHWLKDADANNTLHQAFHPPLSPNDKITAQIEGWILGAT
jgi:hypothetical protein